MSVNVIPDSIEPYVGWKAFYVRWDGDMSPVLHSPTYDNFRWPARLASIATCATGFHRRSEWKWVVSTERRGTSDEEIEVLRSMPCESLYSSRGYISTAAMMVTASHYAAPITAALRRDAPAGHSDHIPDRPRTHLTKGSWVLQQVVTEIGVPGEECACGIYIAKKVGEAVGYLHGDGVLARVAGWGKTVPASMGARVEKAYPQEIYAVGETMPLADQLEQKYGVPVYPAVSAWALMQHLEDPRHDLLTPTGDEEALALVPSLTTNSPGPNHLSYGPGFRETPTHRNFTQTIIGVIFALAVLWLVMALIVKAVRTATSG